MSVERGTHAPGIGLRPHPGQQYPSGPDDGTRQDQSTGDKDSTSQVQSPGHGRHPSLVILRAAEDHPDPPL